MYEHKSERLASRKQYRNRIKKNLFLSFLVISVSLLLGILGYKFTVPEFDWYDSLLNASMILSGMGPVIDQNIMLTPSAKVFASIYALFSGVTFLTTFSLLMAPIVHRFFHKMNIESDEDE